MPGGGNTFAKTICSICFEDLKPIVEDLQSISSCGHVFHELCIQQWFEYCKNGKKKNCPVCKQTCSTTNVARLYFQSVGDPNDTDVSEKPINKEDLEGIRWTLEKLEKKTSVLTSNLKSKEEEIQELSAKLSSSEKHADKQTALKSEALRQKVCLDEILHEKSKALDKSTLECKVLRERNLALAQELASVKLASDVNLEEEEIGKLASLGNGNKETVDKLKKTLIIRNMNYKALMAKCNTLGRGEASSLKKLEKSKEKIKKMKARIQELEMTVEVKENDVLRSLKASKKNPDCPRDKTEPKVNSIQIKNMVSNQLSPQQGKDYQETDYHIVEDNNAPKFSHELPKSVLQPSSSNNITAHKQSLLRKEAIVQKLSNNDGTSDPMDTSVVNTVNTITIDDDDALIIGDIKKVQTPCHGTKETPPPVPIAKPDFCFSGWALGPDGGRRHLGKWCKRSNNNEEEKKGTNSNLIAVGADGRGGKIKVLRSLDQSSPDVETSSLAKRLKYGAKTGSSSSSQSQGCLQIEHFFAKQRH
ncbi:uncharacterized protein LOC124922575 isoform X2 [Impatiens glandulifera]|uniref:uncharacterized protein LOC124922575 isoform X2 n=1 Tax=Impatiens glandulifera TaxID=253017 RepID=UPI001FB16196|nr:uncharacterized protein LOC124922575 isoform X2 [Impatiens glandulifera]